MGTRSSHNDALSLIVAAARSSRCLELAASPPEGSMDCTTDSGFVILALNNKFEGDVKVRTCADAIACSGNPLKANHYNDCPHKLAPGSRPRHGPRATTSI